METINRRKFINALSALGIGSMLTSFGTKNNILENNIFNSSSVFTLPELPYGYDTLEPFFDKETMLIHHTKHHQAYVNNLNKLILNENITFETIEDILGKVSNYSVALRNNVGGHYNHSLFWQLLTPLKTSNSESFKINEALTNKYGSMKNFKDEFEKKAMTIFGSGWCWLIINEANKFEIITTQNQDNPLMHSIAKKTRPILALDIWEHAYYLKYQNKRGDYLKAWWQIVNWDYANKLYINK